MYRYVKYVRIIHDLILLVTHLKYYDAFNCDLIKFKDLYWLLLWEVIIKEIKDENKNQLDGCWFVKGIGVLYLAIRFFSQ